MSDNQRQPARRGSSSPEGLGFVIPIVIGAVMGYLTDQFWLWLTVGAVMGVAISASYHPDERR